MKDNIDIELLSLISKEPKITLRELNRKLKKKGIKLSVEGVRKRIHLLFKNIILVPFADWKVFDLALVVVIINVRGGVIAKRKIIRKIKSLGSFLFFVAFGVFDMIAFFTLKKGELPAVIDKLKELNEVESISHSVITQQNVVIENIFRN